MNDRAQILITAVDQTKAALASVKAGLEGLSGAAGKINGMLAGLGAALSVAGLMAAGKASLETADIGGHRFLPIPAQVQPFNDLQTSLEVSTIRLDLSAEWASNGAVLDTWSAVSSGGDNPAAYTDFYCYYLGCAWWTSPPPLFNWNLVPRGCIEDLIFRALPTAITQVQVHAGSGEPLDTITLSNSNAGTIDSRPLVARHRIFNSPGTPHFVLPEVSAGPAVIGVTQERVVALPDCLVGKVELAPDNMQDFNLFQQGGAINVSAEPGTVPGTIKLQLLRNTTQVTDFE